jgi:hypothetical protein
MSAEFEEKVIFGWRWNRKRFKDMHLEITPPLKRGSKGGPKEVLLVPFGVLFVAFGVPNVAFEVLFVSLKEFSRDEASTRGRRWRVAKVVKERGAGALRLPYIRAVVRVRAHFWGSARWDLGFSERLRAESF